MSKFKRDSVELSIEKLFRNGSNYQL